MVRLRGSDDEDSCEGGDLEYVSPTTSLERMEGSYNL